MPVEFSELATAGIKRQFPDESRQKSVLAALRFYLRDEHASHSYPCPAFDDVDLWVFPMMSWRVLYSVEADRVLVWSIARLSGR